MNMKVRKQIAQRSPFSEADQQRLNSMLNGVWQYIGSDCLQLSQGRPYSRANVIEAVLDTGRLDEMYKATDDAALIARFRAPDYDTQEHVAKLAFPFARYGY